FLVYHVIQLTLKAIYGNWLDIVFAIADICESWIALLFTSKTRPSTPSFWPTCGCCGGRSWRVS
ncbi:MAG: hypothetical protein ACKPKO_34785, partial [Candidatus Fonsibacter sp.]